MATAGPRDTVEVFNVTQNRSTPVLIDPNGGFLVLVQALVTDRLQDATWRDQGAPGRAGCTRRTRGRLVQPSL